MPLFGRRGPFPLPGRGEIRPVAYEGAVNEAIWLYPSTEFAKDTPLIVRPMQEAVFVRKGQILSVFDRPGTYILSAFNYGFVRDLLSVSERQDRFECEIYFVCANDLEFAWEPDTPMPDPGRIGCSPGDFRSAGGCVLRVMNGARLIESLLPYGGGFTQGGLRCFFAGLTAAFLADILTGLARERALPPPGDEERLQAVSRAAGARIARVYERFGLVIRHFSVTDVEGGAVYNAADNRPAVTARRMPDPEENAREARTVREAAENPDRGFFPAGDGFGGLFPGPVRGIINPRNGAERGILPDRQEEQDSFERKAGRLKYLLDSGMISQEVFREKLNQLLEGDEVRPDRVLFSAVAPREVRAGEYGLIDIFMYEPDCRQAVDEAIKQAETPVRETVSGMAEAKKRSRVRVALNSPDISPEEDEDEQVWQGGYLRFSFAWKLPEDYAGRQILFNARVYIDDVIVTRLRMIVACGAAGGSAVPVKREDITSAFISYASQDRQRVAAIIQGMRKINPALDIFFDVESLRSGDDWEKALYREISGRDMFFLCWSHFARESKWVDAEWRYALREKGIDSIEPVPIEPPDLCPPPDELSKKHFNDKLLFIINAGEDRRT